MNKLSSEFQSVRTKEGNQENKKISDVKNNYNNRISFKSFWPISPKKSNNGILKITAKVMDSDLCNSQ